MALVAAEHAGQRPPAPPSPAALADGLARLAADAPGRYLAVAVAEAVATLVGEDGR